MRLGERTSLAPWLCALIVGVGACTGHETETAPRKQAEAREDVQAVSSALVLSAITATKVGHYRLLGGTYSLGSSTNYRSGNYNTTCCGLGTDDYRRGYVVFDLTGVNGNVTAATLSLSNSSNTGSAQLFELYQVDPNNIASLGASCASSAACQVFYTDLGDTGSGGAYGATVYYSSSTGTPTATSFALGGSAPSALNTAIGSASKLFAVGVKYYEGATNGQYMFDDVAAGATLTLTVNNRSQGQTCSVNGDCASGFCTDGYCCSSACGGGSCDVCAASLGASANGTCTNLALAASSLGSPSCTPYYCNGAATCPTTCASDAACISSYYCNGTNCVADQPNGNTCTSASQCTSGNCVDGRCCNTACGGGANDCQACSVAAGAAANGTCGALSSATVCRSAASSCDQAETCPGPAADPYYQDVTLSNTGGAAQTAFQVRLTISSGNTNFWNHLDGGAAATGHDIYIVDSGASPLSYWIEKLDTAAQEAWIWVKVPSVAAPPATTTLRIYYGSSTRTASSSIQNTMIFGDEFESCGSGSAITCLDSSRWTVDVNTGTNLAWSTGAGTLRMTTNQGRIHSTTAVTTGMVVETKFTFTSADSTNRSMVNGVINSPFGTGIKTGHGVGTADTTGVQLRYYRSGTWDSTTVSTGNYETAYSRSTINVIGTGASANTSLLTVWSSGTSQGSNTFSTAYTPSSAALALGRSYDDSYTTTDSATFMTWDWALIRKYAATPPTLTISGTEVDLATASFNCPTDVVAAAGTVCRSATDACDSAESCNGTDGTCPADTYLASTVSCRSAAGECDLLENCTGTSAACPSDAKKSNGTACTDDGNACSLDRCDGSAVACQHPAGNAGTTCRSAADVCDVAETCTGASTICPTDVLVAMGTSCRSAAGECDIAEACTGAGPTCPADSKRASGTACTADSNVCTLDQCDGSAAACQHPAGNAGMQCRAGTTVCDPAESCTGASTTCPADAYAGTSTVCRPAADECDAIEYCTGASAACPATDAKKSSGTACTADSNACTLDQCNGSSDVCQHPAGNAGTSCRSAAGTCDVAETCTGASTVCPTDVFAGTSTVCRSSAGTCDVVESCTGTGAACPSDTVVANGTVCRPLDGAAGCDVAAESCNGVSGACPADTYQGTTTTCRASAGACDLAEMCPGTSNACPSNAFSTAMCRAAGGVCDTAEFCTGSTAACPTDVLASSSTPCRFQAGSCDAVDYCTGASAICPADAYAPVGTNCGYTTGATTIYSTGTPTNSAFLNAGYSAASVTNAGPTSAWTDAIRYSTTLPTTGANQYLYQSISTTAHKLQAYDMIEYDVYLADSQGALGGLDMETSAGSLRGQGITDQNGVGQHPATNIASNAYGQWYHRRYILGSGSALVNATTSNWTIVDENDTAHAAYTAYYDNVIVASTAGECNGANVCKIKADYGCTAASDCATNVCNSTTLDASNIYRWDFTSNANSVVGSANGTASGSPTFSGGGVVLTGTTTGPYVDLPNAVMSGLTNVTFEIWFSINALSATTNWERLIDFGASDAGEGNQGNGTQYIFFSPDSGADTNNYPRVAFRRSGGSEVLITGTSSLPSGTLTHAAITVTGGSTMSLYVNATLIGSVALGASDTLANISFVNNWLGRSQYNGDTELYGTIYDFRIYNKALSAAEVLATYRKGVDSKVCFAQYPNGIACTQNAECLSGFCVDGRCCATACDGGDTTNCQACSVAAGSTANGTCATAVAGTVCRPSATGDSCDLQEVCTGASTTCPADTQ